MGVDHRRTDVAVSQQLLDRSYIVSVLKQMSRKRMAKSMATCGLVDACANPGILYGFLQNRLVEMVPALLSDHRVSIVAGGRKSPSLQGDAYCGKR